MTTNMQKFNAYHAYQAISSENGMQCRICSRVYYAQPSNFLSFCPDRDTSRPHHRDYDEDEAVLGDIFCDIQDQFFDELGLSCGVSRSWPRIDQPFPFRSQRWWWTRFCMAYKKCEESLLVLSHPLRSLLQHHQTLPLSERTTSDIRELKFVTNEDYGFFHCAFKIRSTSGAWFVFEPTGVQFGANWPVLSTFDEYILVRIHPGLRWPVHERPLGRQKEWLPYRFWCRTDDTRFRAVR